MNAVAKNACGARRAQRHVADAFSSLSSINQRISFQKCVLKACIIWILKIGKKEGPFESSHAFARPDLGHKLGLVDEQTFSKVLVISNWRGKAETQRPLPQEEDEETLSFRASLELIRAATPTHKFQN